MSAWLQSSAVPSALVLRAQIVLLASQGMPNTEIAQTLGVSRPTVIGWRRRYSERGLDGLTDEHRHGRPREIDHSGIVAATLQAPSAEFGIRQWSTRMLAAQSEVSDTTVAKVWREYGIIPWRTGAFRFATNPQLEAFDVEIVGLYVGPPDAAVALHVDDTSRFHPLSSPRNALSPLLSALTDASGPNAAVDRTSPSFPEFVAAIIDVHPDRELHLIFDDQRRTTRGPAGSLPQDDPRVRTYSTPTHALWLNLLQVWSSMTRMRADSPTVADLDFGIRRLVGAWDRRKRFAWTKTDRFST